MLLADPALRRPHLAARQEQDVEARVHPQHAQRRRRRCKQNLYTSTFSRAQFNQWKSDLIQLLFEKLGLILVVSCAHQVCQLKG